MSGWRSEPRGHRFYLSVAFALLCGLFVAGCDGGNSSVRFTTVLVPAVAGETRAEVEAALLAAGLTVGSVTTANSDTVAAGLVISLSPAAGASVRKGSAVSIVVSLGPLQVVIPDVTDQTQASAEAALVAAGLTVGTVTTANSDTVAAGLVISVTPAPGGSVARGTAISLVVSLGPVQVVVPDVVGQTQAGAEAALVAVNLTVGSVTSANSDSVAAGLVISLNPAAGASVARGSAVALVISLGPVQVVVPDVVGQTQASAEAALVAVNLTVGSVTTANSDSVAAGLVISLNPAAGASVAQGSAVALVVSLGPLQVVVPDVVGQAQASAEAALVAADLTVGGVTTANSDTVAEGLVISQAPAGGTSVVHGSAVALVVSLGPLQVVVPDVVGEAQASAEAALVAADLTVGSVTTANSDTVAEGLVISQDPAGGASVVHGSAVALVVSLGPLQVVVPDVVGQAQASAEAALVAADLTIGSVTTANSDTVAEGLVISQDPAGGASVAQGSAVALVVSLGAVQVVVPDVVGQAQADAEAALLAADLTVGGVTTANSNTVAEGLVISQNPASGMSVAQGSAVALVVSTGQAADALTVAITSPGTLLTVGSTPLSIEGTVSDASATLTVNGVPITASNGTFNASVALTEGHNTIIARALSGAEEATATISVSLDMTPPYITIASPAPDSVVTTDLIAVSGLINDIVRGTVSDGQANVTVNGVQATVANRTYLAENVPLVAGQNTLTVQGSDQVGNTSTVQAAVTYTVPGEKRIELVSGQSQRASIRATLGEAFRVRVLDAGAPAPNAPVVFRVVEGDGEVGVGGADQGQAVLVQTDASGEAETLMQLGSRAGNGNNHVTAKAVGFEGQVDLYASADTNPVDKVSVNSGNNQRGAANQPLPLPFVVSVSDDGANVIEGAAIEFRVTQGSGKLQNGLTSFSTTTDSDGRAGATLTLGSETGLDSQRVTATLVGSELYAGFTASALTSGDPGQTSISGVVLDNQDQPLPNVTIRVDGTTRQALTDEQGQFRITEVPVGPVHLVVDGSTTTAPGEWPTLPYNLVTVAGADNPLSAPVYMVKLDNSHAVWVGNADQVLTLPELPGFELAVKAGSVTFPSGDREGYLSVTPVNASKVPMPPPNGMQPQLIVTIQPTGARFDPPAPLQLPNVDGHAPGAQVEMYSFDHDLEEFVSIGVGTVSGDGQVIRSNPGVGVIKAGWHCGSQPSGGGCASSCPICQDCDSSCNCVAKDGDPRLSSQPKCTKCASGAPVPPPTPSECCAAIGASGGFVVCCATSKVACADSSFDGAGLGETLRRQCVIKHEEAHFGDIDCPTGSTECDTSRPPFKPGRTQADGECDASHVEVACLEAANCGGDATCQAIVDGRATQIRQYGNANKPGCFP